MRSTVAGFRYIWREHKTHFLILAVVAVVAIVVYALQKPPTPVPVVLEDNLADQIRVGKAPVPEYTDAVAAKLEKGNGFAALVSYTDRGFEPSTATIRVGESVRFTNNSSRELWIASSGEKVAVYPRSAESCGSSELDSCEPFSPQDFWEFTFSRGGTFEVVNNLDKSTSGFITVE